MRLYRSIEKSTVEEINKQSAMFSLRESLDFNVGRYFKAYFFLDELARSQRNDQSIFKCCAIKCQMSNILPLHRSRKPSPAAAHDN